MLFLQSPENAPGVVRSRYDSLRAAGTMKATPLMENYRLTTKNLSKFTVIRNPETGREMVTRVNFDKYGLLPTSEAMENYVKALESNTPTIDVEKSGRTLRIPVGIDKPPARPARTLEEKIRRMRRFSANWEDFEFQVQDILQHPEKSGRIATLAGVETPTEPTKD